MTPHYADDWLTVYGGDARTVLAELPADSVDCIVTSPPYWGLRDYGTDGQLGLEATPEQYVANLVGVFRELQRVLKPSGTAWLNLGDSYATGGGAVGRAPGGGDQGERFIRAGMIETQPNRMPIPGLKPKDLVGIPWRVAFALQADGWYLRSDIIWAKPNPMPESVTDRPTKAHEYLFLLTKSSSYYFDQDAVREQLVGEWMPNGSSHPARPGVDTNGGGQQGGKVTWNPSGRNLRSVWTIATRPYAGAHFAVFPPELPERCIKAGSSEKGVCPDCGAPWEQVQQRDSEDSERKPRGKALTSPRHDGSAWNENRGRGFMPVTVTKTGWRPTCSHGRYPVPATILDPFAGSGTVGLVANRLSRRAILIDLNPAYLEQQMKRNAQVPAGL